MSYIKLADYVVNYFVKLIMSFEIKTNLMKNINFNFKTFLTFSLFISYQHFFIVI
jgi:hypothetical protein